jgi:hypothetical protein
VSSRQRGQVSASGNGHGLTGLADPNYTAGLILRRH